MKFVTAAIASLIAAGAANAGGYTAPVVEAAPVEVAPVVTMDASDWSGFYAGLQYGQGEATASLDGEETDTDFDAYGVHGGYNHDFGKYVLGGELDYNKVDLDNDGGDADLTRLRARAGYDLGRFLPYVTLGAAHISGDGDLSETDVTYGIGADYKVTEMFTVGAEYTKQDFSDVDNVDGLDLDTDMVQVRASYHF
ncbi:outer membrane protein [Paracoccus sediminilitoris]|uniref:outer membrane protein n=1 Tax=Paracoccus sediminilitoris TaxID=2202419 RepID=UPI00272AA2F8|nr:porin family protein [Paracoccus sediminilitoris]